MVRIAARVLRAAALILAALAATVVPTAAATGVREAPTVAIGEIAVADLPPQARAALDLIRQGGPYSYPRDGTVFGNFERRLPPRARGYYREYTVPTPGLNHRGARRIVVGEGGERYYTDDHYRSFRRITP